MSELPNGWAQVQLGDLIDRVEAGLNVRCEERPPNAGEVGLVKISAVTWSRFDEQQSKTLPVDSKPHERFRIKTGDLLISRANTIELVGACVVVGAINRELYLSDKVLRLVAGDPLRHWINYALKTPAARKSIEEASSGNQLSMRNISQERLRALPIDLAPAAEQQRIVAKLNTLLSRVDGCRERLERVGPLIKRFRQSVLRAATTGALTEFWRAAPDLAAASDPASTADVARVLPTSKYAVPPDLDHWAVEVPESWEVLSVGQFAECLDRMRVPVKRELRNAAQGLYPYFGANGEVGRIDEFIFDDELVLVTEDETFYGREKPIAYRSSGPCWVNNHAHVLRPVTKSEADYLCFALMHYDVLPWLTGTTGRAKLTQKALLSLPIAVPPKPELEEVVRQAGRLLRLADELDRRLALALQKTKQLTPATLAKAFRGELVPQDLNDEPADALLARIRAEREMAAAAPRRRRPWTAPA